MRFNIDNRNGRWSPVKRTARDKREMARLNAQLDRSTFCIEKLLERTYQWERNQSKVK